MLGNMHGVAHHAADLLLGDGLALRDGALIEAIVNIPSYVAMFLGETTEGNSTMVVVFTVLLKGLTLTLGTTALIYFGQIFHVALDLLIALTL